MLLVSKNKRTAMIEQTCALIKPHAVKAGNTGLILTLIELNKFTIERMELVTVTRQQGEQFYAVHKGKPFFEELVANITAGPLVKMVLSKENAIKDWRELMGSTDPQKAAPGTLRKMFGQNISFNAAHGSDSLENARLEIKTLFGSF